MKISGEFTLSTDLGGTNTKIALVKNEKNIIARRILSTEKYKGKKLLINKIAATINDLLKSNNVKKGKIKAVGIGVAGPVDFKKGLIHRLVNVKGWHNVYLKRILSRKLKLKVYMDNDVNLVTLGEYKYGAGRGTKNMICITLGTGVGGGIILDGNLYRGSGFTAGEVGHIPINVNGPRCNCGGKACLERYVSNYCIVEEAKKLVRKRPNSKILKFADGKPSKITPKVISEAAHLGDKLAIKIWKETGVYIGVALTGLVNVFNPECIVIGGGVSLAGDVLFNSIRETVARRAMKEPAQKVKIVPAELGNDAGLIGASILATKGK